MNQAKEVIFSNRVTDVWDYPKLSIYNNEKERDPNYFAFLSTDNKSFTRDMRLYVHIPFCQSFCSFCQFYKEPCNNEEMMRQYVDAVVKELQFYAGTRYMSDATVSSIYFGGGDPSCLKYEYFEQIMAAIKRDFRVTSDVSITVEGNVKFLLDRHRLAMYMEHKVSRISFGVQTFNESIRKKLLLKPSLTDIHHLIGLFKDFHFSNYTFDLMYNLPDQTIDDLASDIEQAIQLDPHFIDFFNLNIYPNTRFYETVYQKDVFKLKPSKANEYRMVKHIHEDMTRRGYDRVCSVTYSRREREPHFGLKQFLQGSDMLGIGASARSFLYNKSYRNVCSVQQYIGLVEENRLPVETGLSLGEEEISTRRIVLFPTLLRMKQEDLPDRTDFLDKINILIRSGYLEEDEDYIRLTVEGATG